MTIFIIEITLKLLLHKKYGWNNPKLGRLGLKSPKLHFFDISGKTHELSVFPNTRAWEQQEWNKIKKQTKKAKRGMSMESSKEGKKEKRNLDGLKFVSIL